MKEFQSGAKSSELKPRYDLIPIEALDYIAARLAVGVAHHGENNYKRGVDDKTFITDRINHAIAHLQNYANRNTTEDTPKQHLQAAITNLAMLCYLEEHQDPIEQIISEYEDTFTALQ